MKQLVYIVALVGLSVGCGKSEIDEISSGKYMTPDENMEADLKTSFSKQEAVTKKMVDSVQYNFRIVSMTEFTGVNNHETSQSNEHVLILSIKDLKNNRSNNVLKNALMDQAELSKYMLGQVCSDIELHQHGDTLIPNGVLYEGQTGDPNSLRAYLFIENYKPNKNTTVQFYDRIFGNGIVKRNLIQ